MLGGFGGTVLRHSRRPPRRDRTRPHALADNRRRRFHRLPPGRPLLARGRRRARPRRPLDGVAWRTSRRLRAIARFALHDRQVDDERSSPSSSTQADVVVHLAAAVGVRADRRATGARDRDERALHGGRARARRHEGGRCCSPRPARSTARAPRCRSARTGICRWAPTDKARWAYACSKAIDEFLALAYWRERGCRCRRAGCSTPSARARPALRDGRAALVGQALAGRAADRLRRRRADALLLPRRGRRAGAGG